MTTIHGLGVPTSFPASRRQGPARDFRVNQHPAATADEAEAASASGVGSVSLAGLLAMQEAGAGSVRDRAARRHAQRMLALLRDLQRAMLAAGDAGPDDVPARLAALAATDCQADAPGLAAILRAIAVRAAVELARHERHASPRD